MPTTPIPELEPKRTPEPEVKQPPRPEPELKTPRKGEPEIEQPTTPAKPEVGDDQGDSGPDRENPITEQSQQAVPLDRKNARPAPVDDKDGRPAPVNREDGHIGATEEQVSDTTAPSGDAFKDEPRQG
jgi:hypothetical protein